MPIRVRRMLERPLGSVRWNDDAVDAGVTGLPPISGSWPVAAMAKSLGARPGNT